MRRYPYAPKRWYEMWAASYDAVVSPADRLWWGHLYWMVARPIYEWLWYAGLIDVREGDLWENATIAPLGTPPRKVR